MPWVELVTEGPLLGLIVFFQCLTFILPIGMEDPKKEAITCLPFIWI